MIKHKFAIYFDNLTLKQPKQINEIAFNDPELLHRVTRVLKIQENEIFVLFNSKNNIELQLSFINKDKIICKVINFSENKTLSPHVHWILPVLEKKAFEETISNLTVLGATYIYPVITEKVHRKSFSGGELERLNRVMISAAEQSKQFTFPQIMPVNSLAITINNFKNSFGNNWSNSLKNNLGNDSKNNLKANLEKGLENNLKSDFKNSFENNLGHSLGANLENNLENFYKQIPKIFFDPSGESCFKLTSFLKEQTNLTDIICIVGPEGDLTENEKKFLKQNNFSFYALTPTILRSELAATLATGILRSLFNK
jgi:RsmE family RNA methyltransferase